MEAIGNKVESGIAGVFYRIGDLVATRPKTTIAASILLAVACGAGMTTLTTENRPEKLWVPQNTIAEVEQASFKSYFPPSSRFNNVIVRNPSGEEDNILTKKALRDVMRMHLAIEESTSEFDNVTYTFIDLCSKRGGSCINSTASICQCAVTSVLKQWNYDLDTLDKDDDFLTTLNAYGSDNSTDRFSGVLGNPTFDQNGKIETAEAINIIYFSEDRSEDKDGNIEDPVNEAWEEAVFLKTLQGDDFPTLKFSFLSARSFSDEFGGAITGDLVFVQVSYVLAFAFLGATLGRFKCGPGSRWAMAFSALILVALSTVAGFGISSGVFKLFFGPVHSLLPFILLGIGVDDVFVIVNAFNRERNVARQSEDDEGLRKRSAKALSRAGASITVTSLTDLVAFAISSSSALPALASFCAYASICIFFLWAFAATFFTAAMVQDERRQKENRRDCLCCLTRKADFPEDNGEEEGKLSNYFRKYHAPAILSKAGKIIVILFFSALLAFGIYGAVNLPVEDTERQFIPKDSYVNDYIDSSDEFFSSSNGISLSVTFENGEQIYQHRDQLAKLSTRITGLSQEPPYIAEPTSNTYQNVMEGFYTYLEQQENTVSLALGEDGWPTTYADFVSSLKTFIFSVGNKYIQDVSFDNDTLSAFRVKLEYVKLLKENRGETIDDAERQIKAMDATREMVDRWNKDDALPTTAFPYSDKFLAVEGFKIISQELFRNVGLAIAAVGVIVLFTIASPGAAFVVTLNVAFCIIEILGFMYAVGIVIDSVSVINIVLAVGLSVDYSAHIGHCFMTKGGSNKDARATEALADIGASVLNGATSTFLAVAVLLFSSSYVFQTLSIQFALTVILGVAHGLILLPVMLSLVGPKAFSSAEEISVTGEKTVYPEITS